MKAEITFTQSFTVTINGTTHQFTTDELRDLHQRIGAMLAAVAPKRESNDEMQEVFRRSMIKRLTEKEQPGNWPPIQPNTPMLATPSPYDVTITCQGGPQA